MNTMSLSPRDLDLLTFVYNSAGVTIDLRYDRYRVNRLVVLAMRRLVKLTETDHPDKLRVDLYPAGCRALGLSEHTYKTKQRRRAHPVIVWERQRRESLVESTARPACLEGVNVAVLVARQRQPRPIVTSATPVVEQPVTAPSQYLVVRVAKTGKVNMASTILNVTLTLAREVAVTAEQVHGLLAELVEVSHRVSYTRAYLRDWVRKGYLRETSPDHFIGTGKLD